MGKGKNKDANYYIEGSKPPRTPRAGQEPDPWGKTTVVGGRTPRVDAYERVSGTARFPSDVHLPGMLFAAVVRCPHPRARVKALDLGPALAMAGVRGAIGVGGREARIPWTYDRAGVKVRTTLFPEQCRFEGEPVAAVAADSPNLAARAARAVAVSYEAQPFVSDELAALKKGAPAVHPGGNEVSRQRYARGELKEGLAAAEATVARTYRTACQLHTPLELHGCVAAWDGDSLTVHESTQGVYPVQQLLAKVLGLPLSRVRVVGHYVGGGFGAKLWADQNTVIAALLARKTGRPVRLFISREETMLCVGNRPPGTMEVELGAKKDGTLTAIRFSGTATGGAYPASGGALLDWLARDLYTCPNVSCEVTDVYTNAGPARPFRAPGHPQGAWALEQALDELAQKLGLDPVALRLANVPERSQAREGNPPYTTTGLRTCLERGAEVFGWREAVAACRAHNKKGGDLRRGVGMAACQWIVGDGRPPATVLVKLLPDGSVGLNMGASDIGTGTKTVMSLVVAEELGVRPEVVQVEWADTGTTHYASASGGSKTVPTEAPAVRAAAIDLKRRVLDLAAAQLGVPARALRFEGDRVSGKGKAVALSELSELQKTGAVIGVGQRGPNPKDRVTCPFGAQFCEVEVFLPTGELRLVRFLGVHESGRVMDRLTFDNQVFGGITMGIGFGVTEARVLDPDTGRLCNRSWHDYKLPTALDVPPKMVSEAVDLPADRANSTGAKGLGEPVTIPTAAAVANAVAMATGLRFTDTPLSTVTLNRRLAAKEG